MTGSMRNLFTFEQSLTTALLDSKDPAALQQVQPGSWNIDAVSAELLQSTVDHYLKYKTFPGRADLRLACPHLDVAIDALPTIVEHPPQYYIDQLRKRALSSATQELIGKALDDIDKGNVDEALSHVKSSILLLGKTGLMEGGCYDFSDGAQARYDDHMRLSKLTAGVDGVPSGWPSLDEVTAGSLPGDLNVLVGRPNVGKSWSLLLMAEHAWKVGRRPLFISMEMIPERLGKRLDSVACGLPYETLRKGQLDEFGKQRYREYIESEYPRRGEFPCSAPPRVRTVQDIDLAISETEPEIVFIDAAYLVKTNTGVKRFEQVSDTFEGLKELALSSGIPIWASTQFNREGGRRAENRGADMEQLAYAYTIAFVADNILGVFSSEDLRRDNRMMYQFMKVREGRKGDRLAVNWDFETMNFEEVGVVAEGEEIGGGPVEEGVPW